MEYGYIRSATKDRDSLEEQRRILNSYGVVNIIEEKEKTDLKDLLDRLQAGDILRVTSAERLSRDIMEYAKILNYAGEKGIIIYAGTFPLVPHHIDIDEILKEAKYVL